MTAGEGETFDIELEENLLAKNRELADANRGRLDERGIKAFDVMGAIGSGKTSLIGALIEHLTNRRVGVLAGDLTTTIDADRLAKRGAVSIVQINTGKECHLDANVVAKGLDEVLQHDVDTIFIENVGNLICPAEFPLGSHARVVVVSVTEGPYMMRKHPYIFREARVAVVNKVDLAQVVNADLDQLRQDALAANPDLEVVGTDCLGGEGIPQVAAALGL
ncbi:MAG: hydrogenase nickel incorporation protein HypB [Armatimonadota bacterium]|nr:MAG: hydrogenase nickel incorporation protein HypB [Armatimonadota bacterium]